MFLAVHALIIFCCGFTLDRFEDSEGRRRLVEALCQQMVTEGNSEIAAHLADKASIKLLADKEHLIHQDKSDKEVHFVILGRVRVLVNGTEVAIRTVGQHIGEMATIDPTSRRFAAVVADGEAVVASVTEPIFAALAHKHPDLWRRLALELAAREAIPELKELHDEFNAAKASNDD